MTSLKGPVGITPRVLVAMVLLLLLGNGFTTSVGAFTPSAFTPHVGRSISASSSAALASIESESVTTSYNAVFDFGKSETVQSFDRIDDAIMGGISTSALRDVADRDYASWSGVCRTDGGGFCGTRTLPFRDPLVVGDAKGIYLDARLASDNEPERRIWKVSIRTERSRGEELYQAAYALPKNSGETDMLTDNTMDEWNRIKIPFEDFQLVRGARLVDGKSKCQSASTNQMAERKQRWRILCVCVSCGRVCCCYKYLTRGLLLNRVPTPKRFVHPQMLPQ